MANFNKVFLMGNLTRDPELRYTPSGTPVCEFGLATNRTYTTRDGEQREEACFVDVTMWNRRGVVVSEYLTKGDPIFVEGRLKFDTWESSDGSRRSKLRVVAENFEFIGRGGGSPQGAGTSSGGRRQGGGGGSRSQDQSADGGQRTERQPQQRNQQEQPEEESFDVGEDEIPF